MPPPPTKEQPYKHYLEKENLFGWAYKESLSGTEASNTGTLVLK